MADDGRRRVVGVVQARLGSSRLAGKVLADLRGRTVLEHIVRAAGAATELDGLLVAVPETDALLRSWLEHHSIEHVVGPEHDVLGRFRVAAEASGATSVVRLTGDCPLLSTEVLDLSVAGYRDDPCDYLTVEGYPRGLADIEVIATDALLAADDEARADHQREHVGPYFREHDERFRVHVVVAPPELNRPELRLCVDEAADLEAVRRLVEVNGGSVPSVERAIELLDAHPEIRALNEHVQQRS